MVVPLRDATVENCGGKAGALGALLRAGLPVPDGFVVPFDADRGQDLARSVASGLHTLGDVAMAVRSSAGDEDTSAASAAGQHETVLAVRGVDQVVAAIRTCWESLHSPRAVAYRRSVARDRAHGPSVMAVLVQRLVDADAAGVMFTPADGAGETRIEASWGLGPSVVGGTVTPDAWWVGADGHIRHHIGSKEIRLDRAGTRLVTRAVPVGDRSRPALEDAVVARLTRLGQVVAEVLGPHQDVEWALDGDRLWILQARPVTAAPPPGPPDSPPQATRTGVSGVPGSRGVATGTVRIVGGPADFARVRPGDILVCPWTDPAWTPLLGIAAGVITETGGVLSHAAIVAREHGIPAVLGVEGAMANLRDGELVTVDGTNGSITIDP